MVLATPGGGSVRPNQLSRLDVAAPSLNCRVKVRIRVRVRVRVRVRIRVRVRVRVRVKVRVKSQW